MSAYLVGELVFSGRIQLIDLRAGYWEHIFLLSLHGSLPGRHLENPVSSRCDPKAESLLSIRSCFAAMQLSRLCAYSESGQSQDPDNSAFSLQRSHVRTFNGWKRSPDELGRNDCTKPNVPETAHCIDVRFAALF